YDSPYLDAYPEEGKEPAGKGLVYWALARESYIGFTYNKKLVPKEVVPKNFEGLLNPQLKGKMGISIGQTSDKVIGAIIKTKGEELVRTLQAQESVVYSAGAAAWVDGIAAGETVASSARLQAHALLAVCGGAPVGWGALELVPANVGSVACPAQASE